MDYVTNPKLMQDNDLLQRKQKKPKKNWSLLGKFGSKDRPKSYFVRSSLQLKMKENQQARGLPFITFPSGNSRSYRFHHFGLGQTRMPPKPFIRPLDYRW